MSRESLIGALFEQAGTLGELTIRDLLEQHLGPELPPAHLQDAPLAFVQEGVLVPCSVEEFEQWLRRVAHAREVNSDATSQALGLAARAVTYLLQELQAALDPRDEAQQPTPDQQRTEGLVDALATWAHVHGRSRKFERRTVRRILDEHLGRVTVGITGLSAEPEPALPEGLAKKVRRLAHWEPSDDLQQLRTRLACIGAAVATQETEEEADPNDPEVQLDLAWAAVYRAGAPTDMQAELHDVITETFRRLRAAVEEARLDARHRPVEIPADQFEQLALEGRTRDGQFSVGEGGAEKVLMHARRLVESPILTLEFATVLFRRLNEPADEPGGPRTVLEALRATLDEVSSGTRRLTAHELRPFLDAMEREVIPEIERRIRERQRAAAVARHAVIGDAGKQPGPPDTVIYDGACSGCGAALNLSDPAWTWQPSLLPEPNYVHVCSREGNGRVGYLRGRDL